MGADYVAYPISGASGVYFDKAAEARTAAKAMGAGSTVWNDRKGTFLYEAKGNASTVCQNHGRTVPCDHSSHA